MKKHILGLDLGTNSIGWSVLSIDENNDIKPQISLGSRIIPMTQDVIGSFEKGEKQSQTAERRFYRSTRRLYERRKLRRERLLRVLHLLNFLPEHFDRSLGWDSADAKTFAKFLDGKEQRLPWTTDKSGLPQFLFQDSFHAMLVDFKNNCPGFTPQSKVPYDWTIYYLRHKALHAPILKEELAWILLQFNQKRGYYQLRGMGEDPEEEKEGESKEYAQLKVVKIEKEETTPGKKQWYNLHLENGFVYRRSSDRPMDNWLDTVHEFIITTKLDQDGQPQKDQEGNVIRSFTAPKETDWGLIKKRTEQQLKESGMTVGDFIYHQLLQQPSQKICGQLIQTIEREIYKDELTQILKKQTEFHAELRDENLYAACVLALYPHNESHRESIKTTDFTRFFVDDILFYQRPLKSKKYLIANCPYEFHQYVDKETGEIKKSPLKCVARSNPYYQEYRLWGYIQNLRIIQKEKEELVDDNNLFERNKTKRTSFEVDVTSTFFPDMETYARFFDWASDRDEFTMDAFFKDFLHLDKKAIGNYQWNYADDVKIKGNSTRAALLKNLDKLAIPHDFLSFQRLYHLWQLLYSVTDTTQLRKALTHFAEQENMPQGFVDVFIKTKPFEKDYGSYSEKAIKRLLPLRRCGHYWTADALDDATKERINHLIDGEADEKILDRIREITDKRELHQLSDFQCLPEWLACYLVYNRHSELDVITRWQSPEDLQAYLLGFKQYSLRNPIVEQVVLETLRVVHDIWQQFATIDEIHVELSRDLKNPAAKRTAMFKRNLENEQRNQRIRLLLLDMAHDATYQNVRPYSPMQQEILKIYEEGAILHHPEEFTAEYQKIVSSKQPTPAEITKYKGWLQQKYCSPYTGEVIPLSRLFTTDYEIEHIIPQARYFDDSFNNKVICESEVNKLKSNRLAHEFITQEQGREVPCSNGREVHILSLETYTNNVQKTFAGKSYQSKRNNLLADDIPQKFNERQMNDTRYISKLVISLLSNIVREPDEKESTSKNLIPCTGRVTDQLKKDWGLNDVWNDLVYKRFERLNEMTGTSDYGYYDNKNGHRVFQTQVPLEMQQNFNKKRIDHRHHAMDALTIACAGRAIVRYLSNDNAGNVKQREESRAKLVTNKLIHKPWPTFTEDAREALRAITPSFKQHVRILSKASNTYQHYNAQGKKIFSQQQGRQLVVRKSLHKATFFGQVNLRIQKQIALADALKGDIRRLVDKELKTFLLEQIRAGISPKDILKSFKENDYEFLGHSVKKVSVYVFTNEEKGNNYYAVRKSLDDSFNEKAISKITDSGIRQILLRYLEAKEGDFKAAFSPEGLVELNNNIALYNNGHPHQPIRKVRCAEQAGKFAVGAAACKSRQFVEQDKGTNLYFAIYVDEGGHRFYATPAFIEIVERLKQGLSPVPDTDEQGHQLLFTLSPNELVYVPSEEERQAPSDRLRPDRIYKMVSATSNQIMFVPAKTAVSIANKFEFSPLNKMERALTGEMIKDICWKLKIDRLGHIVQIIR